MKKKKAELLEIELLFRNTHEELANATNNRLFMVELRERVDKFTRNIKQLSEKSGIPFETFVHFKITNNKKEKDNGRTDSTDASR